MYWRAIGYCLKYCKINYHDEKDVSFSKRVLLLVIGSLGMDFCLIR